MSYLVYDSSLHTEVGIPIPMQFTQCSISVCTDALRDAQPIPKWTSNKRHCHFMYKLHTDTLYIKATFRDHRVTGALNFHKIRDFCILVIVLDV